MAERRAASPAIIWLLPFYLPSHRAGTQQYVHTLNQYLMANNGFTAVVCGGALSDASFEGVEIVSLSSAGRLKTLAESASLFATAHYPDYAELAHYLSVTARKPLLHLVDSTLYRTRFAALEGVPGQYLLYNSERTRVELDVRLPGMVMLTPVDWRRHDVATSRRYNITLVNVNENKGGAVLIELARRMPHRQFLGVRGAYGTMVIDRTLPNLTYRDQVSSINDVLSETGILLMPSKRESWGMIGVEAMSAGIPVIAHPCSGPRHSLGDAGLFCDRADIDAWVRTIEALDAPEYYRDMSARCRRRARDLDPTSHLERFGAFVDDIIASRI